ncbi:hypothetical protein H696_02496 [Fonticula alba]|uniref:Uncharacterized protein n=1 Tax=Fonticula alba TaxID=691883 RepID=A0A058ZC83_FONAL|nr:hypothetical protein H696_02496 [Fonticula alba]KCV71556.1 hypothetical protein H696_02496 [Fonticula alba]|eukprot:XP_009494679.1 hypothetical protein H696_02496 [Fonticula alba]
MHRQLGVGLPDLEIHRPAHLQRTVTDPAARRDDPTSDCRLVGLPGRLPSPAPGPPPPAGLPAGRHAGTGAATRPPEVPVLVTLAAGAPGDPKGPWPRRPSPAPGGPAAGRSPPGLERPGRAADSSPPRWILFLAVLLAVWAWTPATAGAPVQPARPVAPPVFEALSAMGTTSRAACQCPGPDTRVMCFARLRYCRTMARRGLVGELLQRDVTNPEAPTFSLAPRASVCYASGYPLFACLGDVLALAGRARAAHDRHSVHLPGHGRDSQHSQHEPELAHAAGQLTDSELAAVVRFLCRSSNECHAQREPYSGTVAHDPEVRGFGRTGTYYFLGRPGGVYNIITDSLFSLNARFISLPGSRGTYIGRLGAVIPNPSPGRPPILIGFDILPEGAIMVEQQVFIATRKERRHTFSIFITLAYQLVGPGPGTLQVKLRAYSWNVVARVIPQNPITWLSRSVAQDQPERRDQGFTEAEWADLVAASTRNYGLGPMAAELPPDTSSRQDPAGSQQHAPLLSEQLHPLPSQADTDDDPFGERMDLTWLEEPGRGPDGRGGDGGGGDGGFQQPPPYSDLPEDILHSDPFEEDQDFGDPPLDRLPGFMLTPAPPPPAGDREEEETAEGADGEGADGPRGVAEAAPAWGAPGVPVRPAYINIHVTLLLKPETEPHGILGQTARITYLDYFNPNWNTFHLEGVEQSYEVNGLFETKFPYSRFGQPNNAKIPGYVDTPTQSHGKDRYVGGVG